MRCSLCQWAMRACRAPADHQLDPQIDVLLEPRARGLVDDRGSCPGHETQGDDESDHESDGAAHSFDIGARTSWSHNYNALYWPGMRLEDLGLIGNCQIAALVERSGEMVWGCLPRFDSEPVFSTLLDREGGGRFAVGDGEGTLGTQRYLENTNILETTFETKSGAFRLLDFAPRFVQHDRIFRPTQLLRILEPIHGTPSVRVVCEPRIGWSKARALESDRARNHRSVRGIREPAAAHHRHPSFLPRRAAVRPDRAPTPGADLGRADRRAAGSALSNASWVRRSATGSAG